MKNAQPWFVVATLRAIGRHVHETTAPFSVAEVVSWDETLKGCEPKARLAIDRLLFHKMVVRHEPVRDSVLRPVITLEPRWTLTPKGLGTCRSVARVHSTTRPDPKAMSTRLWSLLRVRRALTAEEAANTLIDAGTRDFTAAQRQIGSYLRAWSRLVPDVVKVSVKPVARAKRYVMVKDGGITPPPTKSTGVPLLPAPRIRQEVRQ